MKNIILLLAALSATLAFGNAWDSVNLKAATDKANPVGYGCGEPIVFTFTAEGAEVVTNAEGGLQTSWAAGLAAYYNAIPTPKSINWVQGSEHGFIPPSPNQTFVVKHGHKHRAPRAPRRT